MYLLVLLSVSEKKVFRNCPCRNSGSFLHEHYTKVSLALVSGILGCKANTSPPGCEVVVTPYNNGTQWMGHWFGCGFHHFC